MQAMYDEKVLQILALFQEGLSREEVAEHFRYASYRSLHEYMRRKNFRWDKGRRTYVEANATQQGRAEEVFYPTEKVRNIVRAFEREEASPKSIAEQLGFEDHLEMAQYMTSKGFEWSSEAENYVSVSATASETDGGVEDEVRVHSDLRGTSTEYLPLLQWLYENKATLEKMIEISSETDVTEQIPRYILQGQLVTKSVHMVNTLDQMVRDFSKEKNISQREVFEVALIDFFRKYGYRREIETFLKRYG